MATATKKFLASVVTLITGKSNPETIAEGIVAQMNLGIETQLAIKKGETFDLEDKVRVAEENVTKALAHNGEEVTNRETAIQKYHDAKKYDVITLKKAVEDPNINVMDKAALALADDYNKDIIVQQIVLNLEQNLN